MSIRLIEDEALTSAMPAEVVNTVEVGRGNSKYLLFDRQGLIYSFDGSKHLVRPIASLRETRVRYSTALSPCGTYVYIFGGQSLNQEFLGTVERYSI